MYRTAIPEKTVDPLDMIRVVLDHMPEGETAHGLQIALELGFETDLPTVVSRLGNGSAISAQDTVPFVLWSVAKTADDFEEVIWQTACELGDIDTNCAMVGGIVALIVGYEQLPETWIVRREPLDDWLAKA